MQLFARRNRRAPPPPPPREDEGDDDEEQEQDDELNGSEEQEGGEQADAVPNEKKEQGEEDCRAGQLDWANEAAKSSHRKRWNVPPKSKSIVLRRDRKQSASTPEQYSLDLLQWGLIPQWSKEPPSGPQHTINATCEKVFEGSQLWSSVRGTKRCIIVAEGFYEWMTKGKEKLPHFIKPADGKLLCMAGFYDHASYGGSFDPDTTFTIITVPANKQMLSLHTRMPAILEDPDEILLWLSEEKWSKQIEKLIRPYEGQLEIYQVPKEVGKVGNDSPTFIQPITRAKGSLETIFAKQSPVKAESTSLASEPKSSPASSSSAKPKIEPLLPPSSSSNGKRPRQGSVEVVDLLDESDGDTDPEFESKPRPEKRKKPLSKTNSRTSNDGKSVTEGGSTKKEGKVKIKSMRKSHDDDDGQKTTLEDFFART